MHRLVAGCSECQKICNPSTIWFMQVPRGAGPSMVGAASDQAMFELVGGTHLRLGGGSSACSDRR